MPHRWMRHFFDGYCRKSLNYESKAAIILKITYNAYVRLLTMKRIISGILVSCTLLGLLAGCGANEEEIIYPEIPTTDYVQDTQEGETESNEGP